MIVSSSKGVHYTYQLATSGSSGPISQTATAKSAYPDLFCPYAHTPSVSSNPNSPATTGIVWTIEHQNSRNNGTTNDCGGNDNSQYHHAALHALNAESLATLYDSAKGSANQDISQTTHPRYRPIPTPQRRRASCGRYSTRIPGTTVRRTTAAAMTTASTITRRCTP